MNQTGVQTRRPTNEEGELAAVLSDWLGAVGLRLRGSLRLAMAETKLAVTTFVLMIFLVVLSAGALTVAWALLLLALVQALSLAGLKLAVAIAIVGAAHVLLAWLLWRFANSLGRHMEFRATRRMLGS